MTANPEPRRYARHPSATGRRRLVAAIWLLLCGLLPWHAVLADSHERPAIPDISYPDLDGVPQNLQQWKGRVLLLNFWASWCAPCQAEIRHLTGYQREFGPAGLQVVGLGLDELRKMRNVQRSLQINYPLLAIDEKESREVLRSWGNKSGLIPYTVIFDRRGQVVQAHRGILDDEQFDALVKPLLTPASD